MKVRVKVSVICEGAVLLQKKYQSIFSEIDERINYEKSIPKVKRIATCLILNKKYWLGNFLLVLIRLVKKIKYR